MKMEDIKPVSKCECGHSKKEHSDFNWRDCRASCDCSHFTPSMPPPDKDRCPSCEERTTEEIAKNGGRHDSGGRVVIHHPLGICHYISKMYCKECTLTPPQTNKEHIHSLSRGIKSDSECFQCREAQTPEWLEDFDRNWSDAADPTPNRKIRIKNLISKLLEEKDNEWRKILNSGKKMYQIGKNEGKAWMYETVRKQIEEAKQRGYERGYQEAENLESVIDISRIEIEKNEAKTEERHRIKSLIEGVRDDKWENKDTEWGYNRAIQEILTLLSNE